MKKFFLIISLLALVSSCTEILIDSTEQAMQTSKEVCITSISATSSATKTQLDQSGRVSLWQTGDRIGIRLDTAKTASFPTFVLSEGAGTNVGSFSGSVTTNTATTLYAMYPAPERFSTISPTTKAFFTIESNQSQEDKVDIAANDYRTGSVAVSQGLQSSLSITFKPIATVINLSVDLSMDYPNDRLVSVSMQAPKMNLAGGFSIDLADVSTGMTAVNCVDQVTLFLTSKPFCYEPIEANMIVAPCLLSMASSVRFVVTTDRRTITFDRKISKDLLAGFRYNLSLSSSTNPSVVSLLSVKPSETEYVARFTGNTEMGETLPNPSNTDVNFNLASTDYGIMWDAGNGTVLSAFGDNFETEDFLVGWRSNTIGITSDRNLQDGVTFSSFVMDGSSRKEIIPHIDKTNTFIPSAGIAVNGRQYLLFSNINATDGDSDPDTWIANYNEIAYSDDYGTTWTRSGVKFDATSNFMQCSYVLSGGFVYVYGVSAGRYGSVHLARVPQNSLLNKSAYRYWTGSEWSISESAAVPLHSGPASELTVFYNSYYKRYIMLYLSVNRRAIVMRSSLSPEGDWSGEQIVQPDTGQGLYGPSVHPWGKDGQTIYYVTSHAMALCDNSTALWNTYLMSTTLTTDDNGVNLITEGGFEDYPSEELSFHSYWYFPTPENGSIETEHTIVHSGEAALKIINPSLLSGTNWIGIFQTIALKPNTDYVMTCWARTRFAGSKALWMGVRDDFDNELGVVNPTLQNDRWTLVEYRFNSNNHKCVRPFINTNGYTTEIGDDLWIYVDDITIKPEI